MYLFNNVQAFSHHSSYAELEFYTANSFQIHFATEILIIPNSFPVAKTRVLALLESEAAAGQNFSAIQISGNS